MMLTNWAYRPSTKTVTGFGHGTLGLIVAKVAGRTTKEVNQHGTLISNAPNLLIVCEMVLAELERQKAGTPGPGISCCDVLLDAIDLAKGTRTDG